jgi:hypothetical protein
MDSLNYAPTPQQEEEMRSIWNKNARAKMGDFMTTHDWDMVIQDFEDTFPSSTYFREGYIAAMLKLGVWNEQE